MINLSMESMRWLMGAAYRAGTGDVGFVDAGGDGRGTAKNSRNLLRGLATWLASTLPYRSTRPSTLTREEYKNKEPTFV